jgi:serine/threonine protein kinase
LAATPKQKVVFNGYCIGYNCVMDATHSLPKRLGDFEIIREIGRGGMGVVYEARQVSLNRRVALKVLSSGLGLTAKAVHRFRREAEAAAKLHHTNIVPIYATGEEHDVHFYAMELIEGPSLDQVIRHLRDGSLPAESSCAPDSTVDSPAPSEVPNWVSDTMAYSPATAERATVPSARSSDATGSGISSHPRYYDQVASMMAEVADALQHAHDEGVIHRDIKPSNLLLSPDGRLSLNDFGLARVLEQPGMTLSGEFVGSPLYMSPEQITAGRAPLDHRTDIYSLGATLYELLTWEPPFPGRQRDQVIGQILHKDPVSPRHSNRHIPIDLETICLKALEKDPDRRYQTAEEMAADLRRFVNHFVISAKRTGPISRAVKWMRRHPAVTGLSALLAVSLCLTCWFAHRIDRARLEKVREDTFLAAMSGDLASAQAHLAEAKKLGASLGWLHLMRGQIAALHSEHEVAVMELEQATSLLENSTAAWAMLTAAYFLANDEDQYFLRLPRLEQMEAVDFYDYLLKAWAESWAMPRQAKASIDEARRQRPHSLVAMLIEAAVLREYALDMRRRPTGAEVCTGRGGARESSQAVSTRQRFSHCRQCDGTTCPQQLVP